MRALKRGYRILYCPELKVLNTRFRTGTLRENLVGELTNYDIHQQAARLHIGIKRYKEIYPNFLNLSALLLIYFAHMTLFLYRKQALKAWPYLIERSDIKKLLLKST